MIRNVVIHITNEQPLLADLFEMPSSADVSLVCSNVRMLDGKKPIFVDRSESVFVFPYGTVRFIEILPGSVEGLSTPQDTAAIAAEAPVPEAQDAAKGQIISLLLEKDGTVWIGTSYNGLYRLRAGSPSAALRSTSWTRPSASAAHAEHPRM